MSHRRPTEAEIRDARRLLGVGPGAPRAAILKAWRDAVRRNHPDAAPEADRRSAEALCSRINAAKDMLLEHPERPPPTLSGNGNGSGRGPASRSTGPSGAAPRRSAKAASPANGHDGHVSTGVAAGPDLAPPRTGLLLTFLVVGFLAVLGIMALTTRDDDAGLSSRIGGGPATSAGDNGSDSVSATTPAEVMSVLMAAAAGRADGLDGVTSPATRLADVDDIVRRLTAADPGERAQARATTTCEAFQPGISDRASCAVRVPEDLLPDPVEMRRVDDSWRVLGYLRGR